MDPDELFVAAKEMQAPYELVKYVAINGRVIIEHWIDDIIEHTISCQ